MTANEKAQSGGAIRFLHNSSRLSDLLHFIFRREKKVEKKENKKRKISWTRAKVAACKVLRFPMGEIPYPAKLAFLFVSRQAQNPK